MTLFSYLLSFPIFSLVPLPLFRFLPTLRWPMLRTAHGTTIGKSRLASSNKSRSMHPQAWRLPPPPLLTKAPMASPIQVLSLLAHHLTHKSSGSGIVMCVTVLVVGLPVYIYVMLLCVDSVWSYIYFQCWNIHYTSAVQFLLTSRANLIDCTIFCMHTCSAFHCLPLSSEYRHPTCTYLPIPAQQQNPHFKSCSV